MQNLFVSYEIAKQLKEKGFDVPCFATYNKEKKLNGLPLYDMEDKSADALTYNWQNSKIHESVITAPLYQQVIDWIYLKYSIILIYNIDKKQMDKDILRVINSF